MRSSRLPQPSGDRRPRLLVFAYACEPGRGSEPGAGWGLVRALASIAQCTVLVGPEHIPAIRRWESAHPESTTTFVEVPEPRWAPAEPRHRFTWFVVYRGWLTHARRAGLTLHRERPFDGVYHATYSTYWLPTPAVDFGVPCVWGPVGGAVDTPGPLRPLFGWRGMLTSWLDRVAVRALGTMPASRRTAHKAAAIVVQNSETLEALPRRARSRATILNHAMFVEVAMGARAQRPGRHCVFAGALESRKGAALAVRALASAPAHVMLHMIGDGPDRHRLEALARQLRVDSRVRFLGRLPREEVLARISDAAAVVFTGLREEGGLALAEAMATGAPVVVLAHGGARTIAESTTDPTRVALVPPADPATTARRIGRALEWFVDHTSDTRAPMLDTAAAHAQLRHIVLGAVHPEYLRSVDTQKPSSNDDRVGRSLIA